MPTPMKELFTKKSNFNDIRNAAKDYGIKVTNKEDTMEEVNRAILKEQGIKNPKWHELHGFMYSKGDVVQIMGGHLEGRLAEVVEPSNKKFAVKAQLIHPKTGENQRTTIVLDYDIIQLSKQERADLVKKEQEMDSNSSQEAM